ncbi:hypothetical protein QBC38DRAFT_157042 [Podospora fimiseda]|uniref:Polycomb protein VEFS-Box domain-containing protein n=1 Tax=Podospora fimiseda TaxID=252190 RepID=A0AAN7BRK8_9PEZI|nr:hypothetical protein QBC38DRAFT_157042 [Podospora fimiseda]
MTAMGKKRRGLPFLHRNWLKTTNHWNKMGNKSSVPAKDSNNPPAVVQDEQQPRAAKRHKIDNQYDGFPLYENYGKVQRGLRIEILKVSHKDAPRVKNGIMNGLVPPNVRDVTQIKARCKLSIWSGQGGHQVMLHVDSQVCDIKVFKNPAGSSPMARFYAIKPFHIPDEKIFLERDDDAVFGLANSYSVQIELESAGDPNWPPGELVSMDDDPLYSRVLPRRQWMLTAHIVDIFGTNRNRKTMRLRVKKHPNHEAATNFLMDVDVRWVSNISTQLAMREQTKGVLPSILVVDPTDPVPEVTANGVNGVNGTDEYSLHDEADKALSEIPTPNGIPTPETMDEPVLAEGETTPSRSRRARQDINYNVKQLWSKAVGKETRKRRKESTEEQAQLEEHIVTYLLPPEQVQTERFGCLICGAENERLGQLRAHYLSHPEFEFIFEFRPKGGYCVTVKPVPEAQASPLRPKIFQLGLPIRPLDLDKFVDKKGDDTWVSERLGPDNDKEVEIPKMTRSQSSLRAATQQQQIIPNVQPKFPRPVVLVPKTKQPLFDPLSKVALKPGQPVPVYPIDNSWLLLKHRQNLNDFIDLKPEEKEYMMEWDAFILPQHISSEAFLPRAFIEFVTLKAPWLVANKKRTREFAKHMSLLIARQVLGSDEGNQIIVLLNDARAAMNAAGGPEAAAEAEAEQKEPPLKRMAGRCWKCEEIVGVVHMVYCSNRICKFRLYHDKCAGIDKTVKGWKCPRCATDEDEDHDLDSAPSGSESGQNKRSAFS